MRFMVMHKVDEKMEAGAPPDQTIVQQMGALVGESLKNGVFVTGAGLRPSSLRARLARRGGEWSEQHGPYTGDNELVASFAMVRAEGMPEALAHARRFAEDSASPAIEVGLVVEPWDIGVVPKPSGVVPQRFLLLAKGDAAFERGEVSIAQQEAAIEALGRSIAEQGALLASGVLAPTAKGVRAAPASGKRTWVDGPFAESKELIAGFSILERASLAEAMAWADRYGAILNVNEIDIRELTSFTTN